MGDQSKSTPPPYSSHRLPPVSASQALQQLRNERPLSISTGVPALDQILVGQSISSANGTGGLVRGQITEVFGPSGVGKTAFGLQAAASAIKDGGHVVWIDTASPLPRPRFLTAIPSLESDFSDQFHHYHTPTLAHLLALIHHPKPDFLHPRSALIVIDGVSMLFPLPSRQSGVKAQSSAPKFASALLQSTLLTALTRLASTNSLAVLLVTQVSTRMRNGAGALLVPAQGSKDWDDGISTQIVLFRDFPPRISFSAKHQQEIDGSLWDRLRYAGIIKVHGVMSLENGMFKDLIPFSLTESGKIVPLELPTLAEELPRIISSPVRPRKRGIEEVPDSEEEWDAELESLDGYDWEVDSVQAAKGNAVGSAEK